MPIRSDRGRNATLRALATWPLHSPRRLASTAATLALLCAGVTLTMTATNSPSTATPTPTATPRITVLTTEPSHLPATASSAPPTAVGSPVEVSVQFAEGWVTKLDPATWQERLAPLCTEEFRSTALAVTIPGQILASAVAGPATLTSSTTRSAMVSVPLDTMMLALTLQDVTGSGDWRVADIQAGR